RAGNVAPPAAADEADETACVVGQKPEINDSLVAVLLADAIASRHHRSLEADGELDRLGEILEAAALDELAGILGCELEPRELFLRVATEEDRGDRKIEAVGAVVENPEARDDDSRLVNDIEVHAEGAAEGLIADSPEGIDVRDPSVAGRQGLDRLELEGARREREGVGALDQGEGAEEVLAGADELDRARSGIERVEVSDRDPLAGAIAFDDDRAAEARGKIDRIVDRLQPGATDEDARVLLVELRDQLDGLRVAVVEVDRERPRDAVRAIVEDAETRHGEVELDV